MKIAISDNNTVERAKLAAMLRTYCEKHGLNIEIESFASGSDLLRRMRQVMFSAVFLETVYETENGMDTARAIRANYSDCAIFFYTHSKDYAIEAFDVGALHYLIKPVTYPRLEEAMSRCGDKLLAQARTLILSPKRQINVFVKDILFIEALNRVCNVYTASSMDTTRKKLHELEDELGKTSFLRCHRSYIVNLEYVKEYNDTDFVLQNGMRVPIRQEGRGAVKRAFRDYQASDAINKA